MIGNVVTSDQIHGLKACCGLFLVHQVRLELSLLLILSEVYINTPKTDRVQVLDFIEIAVTAASPKSCCLLIFFQFMCT